jgi:predicted nucleic acid-binding protein
VVNSSPLIFLSKAGLLDWLQLAADTVLVPEAVAREINRREPMDVTATALTRTSWLRIVAVPAIPPVIQSWDLGPGESAVLAHAYTHPGAIAILDDGLGRRCADLMGIPLHGTLGLVMMAKRRGVITAVRPVIITLKQHGMYLSDRVINRALALIGE